MTSLTIASLHLYPVKSCAAIDLTSAYAGPRGLVVGKIADRSWMVVDDEGRLVTQRKYPAMARIKIELINDNSALRLTADDKEPLILDPATVGDERCRVFVHSDETDAHMAPAAASQWFSDFLGTPVTLVHQKDSDLRPCDAAFTPAPGQDLVGFADGFPYLVANTATLDAINAQLDSPVPMTRFRPNIVVSGGAANDEYTWRGLDIGDEAQFKLIKPCTRCVMTTIDQQTGEKTGKEPLALLSRTAFLAQDFGNARIQGAIFGENAVATLAGTIKVGDKVAVTETGAMHPFREQKAAL